MAFICKAPWTSIAFQPTGIAPCCQYELSDVEDFTLTNDLFKRDRTLFLKGEVPQGCYKCHNAFLDGRPGYYSSFNDYQTNFIDHDTQEINIKANNLCNLACRSCGPHFSSKWEEEFSNSIVITKDSKLIEKFHLIDVSSLKQIVFAGGEPTITDEHVYILKELIKRKHTNLMVRISTNLHSLKYKNNDLIELWKNFPNIYLQISIDAIKENAKSIRSGTNWDIVEKNLALIIKNQIPFYINVTVSALNIWFLKDTIDYLTKNHEVQHFEFNVLTDPDILNIRVIPKEYKNNINLQLDECISNGYKVEHVKKYLNQIDSEELWQHFLIYNLILDATRKESFFNELPIKHDLINRWIRL
jgi:sulfatase maturation enzyme AslB (radical SAM superfamily)